MGGRTLTTRLLAVLLLVSGAAPACVTSEVNLPRKGKLGLRVGTSDIRDFNGSLVEDGLVGPEVLHADGSGGFLLEADYFLIDQLSLTGTMRRGDIDWREVGGASGSGRVDEFSIGMRTYLVHPAWRQRGELFFGLDFSTISVDTGVRDESGLGMAVIFGVQSWLHPQVSVEARMRYGFAYTGDGPDELDHEFRQLELAACWWFGG